MYFVIALMLSITIRKAGLKFKFLYLALDFQHLYVDLHVEYKKFDISELLVEIKLLPWLLYGWYRTKHIRCLLLRFIFQN